MDNAIIGFPTTCLLIHWKVIYLLDRAIQDRARSVRLLSVVCGVRNQKTVNTWPWLFKSDTVDSAIQLINHLPVDGIRETSCAILWMEIYLVNNIIDLIEA